LGAFEPKNDYLVDIPMQSQMVEGNANGVKILGVFTFGAEKQAKGVSVGSHGASTLQGHYSQGLSSASRSNTIVNVGGTMVAAAAAPFADQTTVEDFKAAALRNACDSNNCDVIGYPMYKVDKKNFIFWRTYRVQLKGFPGKVQSLETVPRRYRVEDSYWRKSQSIRPSRPSFPLSSLDHRSGGSTQFSKFDDIEKRSNELLQRIEALEANQSYPVNFYSQSGGRK